MRTLRFSLIALLVAAITSSSRAATPQQVDAAIARAVAYIYSQQKNGNWEVVPQRDPKADHSNVKGWQWGGLSSIATCALLYAGQSPQDQRIRDAVQWLGNAEIYGTYALGFRCQTWAMLPASGQIRQWASRDANLLLTSVIKQGRARGYFPYYFWDGKPKPSDTDIDHSVSQYGVLGLWGCAQLNLEIPPQFWIDTEIGWKQHQHPRGGWSYRWQHGQETQSDWNNESISMTAAGVATLFITQEFLHAMDGLNGGPAYRDPSLERGLAWIAEHFSDYRRHRTFYSLYGLERIGVASGYKYFGKVNWYEDGAEFLVKKQNDDGSFGDGDANSHDNANRIPDTCFALMFLARGRAPVLMNKLQYNVQLANGTIRPGNWNQRPRDAANISRWLGRQIEHDLNWQIVNLAAPVDELHDAPILWICGNEALNLTNDEQQKLKTFVEQGGLILANADMANRAFSESYKKLGQKLFPYTEFRDLPANHPIYTSQQFPQTSWKRKPVVLGLSNGVRELMLLLPLADASKWWQTMSFAGPERQPLAELLANIFLYSVDKKNLRNKGETYLVARDEKIQATRKLKVARLDFGPASDPEPGGWRRLSNIMHNQQATDLSVEIVKLGSGKLTGDFPVAHLTSSAPIKFTPAQKQELQKYIESGGTLIADAAGGKPDVVLSMERELGGLLKEGELLKALPPSHPVYTSAEKIQDLGWRPFARRKGDPDRLRLRGLERGGRTIIFYSPADLSVGLVGQPIDGIIGYDPPTASALMTNMLLYARK